MDKIEIKYRDDMYVVVRGDLELYRTSSRIVAERWVANHGKRKRRAA
jgi:hypothetical protein